MKQKNYVKTFLHYLESSEIYNRTSRAEINEKIQETLEATLL